MKEYVLGFAFDEKRSNVVLVKKNRPEWQAGFLNGVGGKVEEIDIDAFHAMSREFEEETGVASFPSHWNYYATMIFNSDIMGGSAKVHCFKLFSDNIFQCKTMESEEIKIISVSFFAENKIINHLKTLIPMALDDSIEHAELQMN